MTYEQIRDVGWQYEYSNMPCGSIGKLNESFVLKEEGERWIMAIYLDKGGLYNVMINYVDESVIHNEWENSSTHFYGRIKSIEDLNIVMQFIGIKEY